MDSVSEADRLKLAESNPRSHGAASGGGPIRKRGYHRALKRGEVWAVMQKSVHSILSRMTREMYSNPNCPPNSVYSIGGLAETLEQIKDPISHD